ncbi:hypothetical protein CEUSTIGMA_g12654.t1 [Chlamydomonas eustigma]|uniref:Uncharacterized protein n=1 Tax=Chlamydomonas eustigma TaxID=1157962 RepID=A0A250XQ96_9CHLO|nr:hypothetical protein CEUSTIGMA_g12654.t1 [Chlamydomonas eustigma]|eukprot:GAX85234.1 hypothetical protein CEUSTIGMA_g12654.t1 [Chlamydomonas eustigma]
MPKTVSTMIFLYIIQVGLLLSSSSPVGLVSTRPFSGISGSDTGRTLFQLLPPAHLESIAGTDDLLPRTRDLSGLPASSPPGNVSSLPSPPLSQPSQPELPALSNGPLVASSFPPAETSAPTHQQPTPDALVISNEPSSSPVDAVSSSSPSMSLIPSPVDAVSSSSPSMSLIPSPVVLLPPTLIMPPHTPPLPSPPLGLSIMSLPTPPAASLTLASTTIITPSPTTITSTPPEHGSPLNPPSAPHPPNPLFSNDNNNPSSPFVATSSSSQLPAMFPGPSPLPPLPPLPTPLPSISPNLIVDNPLTGSNNLPPLQVDLPPPLQVGLPPLQVDLPPLQVDLPPPLQVGLPPLQVDLPPLVELSPSSPQHIGLSSTIQSPLMLSSSSPPLIIHTFITSPPALPPLLITTPPSPPTFTTTSTSPTTTISSTTVLPTPMTTPLPMNPPTVNPPTNTSPTMTPPIIARTSPTMNPLTMNPPTITSPSMTPPITAMSSPTMNPQSVNQPTINPPTMTTFPAPPSSSFSPDNRPVPASPSTPSSPGFTNETSVPGNITTSSPGVLTSNITTSSPGVLTSNITTSSPGVLTSNITTTSPGVLTSNFAPQQLSQLQLPSDHLPPQLPPQLPQQELVSPTPALSSTPGVPVGALLTNNNSSLSSGTQPNITSTAPAHNSSAANQSHNYVPSSGAAGSSMLPWPYMVAAVGGSAGAVLLLKGIMIMVCLRRRNRLRSSNKVVMAPLVNKVDRSNSQCGYVPGGLCERIIVKGGSEELVLGCTTDNQRDGRSSTTSSNKYQHQIKQVAMQTFPLSSSSCTSETLLLRGNYLFSDDCVISKKVNAITPSSHHKLPSVTRLLKNGCSPNSSLQAINHPNSNKSQTIIDYDLPRSHSNNTDLTGPPCLVQGMPLQPQQAQKDQIEHQSTTIDQPFYPVDCTKSHDSSLLAGSTASNHSLYCRPSTRPPQQLHCKNQISRVSSSSKNEADITSMHFRSDTDKDSIIASSALPDPFLNAGSSIIMLHESKAAVLSAAPQHNEARPGQNNAGYQNSSGDQSIHITYPALQHAMKPPQHQHQHPPPNGNLQRQLYKQVQQPFSTSLHENSLNSPSLPVLSLELIENLSDAPRQCTASLNTVVTSPGNKATVSFKTSSTTRPQPSSFECYVPLKFSASASLPSSFHTFQQSIEEAHRSEARLMSSDRGHGHGLKGLRRPCTSQMIRAHACHPFLDNEVESSLHPTMDSGSFDSLSKTLKLFRKVYENRNITSCHDFVP